MDMDGVKVYEPETIGVEVEFTTTYELGGEILESLPPRIEIIQDFIQNSPLLRYDHYVVTEERHEFISGSVESSEEEEDDSDESPLSPSESDTEHSGVSGQNSDYMEAEEVRGHAAGPRVIVLPAGPWVIVLPANFYIQYITLYGPIPIQAEALRAQAEPRAHGNRLESQSNLLVVDDSPTSKIPWIPDCYKRCHHLSRASQLDKFVHICLLQHSFPS
ncbi:hypothetical protein RRG08_047481 [Elysia crispata]|uniref:Uncharacterized protein n=1 Tax=Elysia crispata TaxID=231223 RepID=A0AAE1BGL2_9GAST|nr:hypothetical protein RRG08_047481 [Elysia crispata]